MRILFLTHSFNSLAQRLFIELRAEGHEVSIEYDIHDEVTREAVRLFKPELILAPFLKRAIPRDIWESVPCWIVHPGVPGDRGPSSLDWAILQGRKEWGVTVLQATEEMDGGPVMASALFPMREVSKSSLYRSEVTEAAVRAVKEALRNWGSAGEVPATGHWQPSIRQEDRRIDWAVDSTETILRKIRSADSSPGLLTELAGEPVHLFGAHPERKLTGPAGRILAQKDGAVCVGTCDGAVWISHLRPRKRGALAEIKRPSAEVLEHLLADVPVVSSGDFEEVEYSEEGFVGSIRFSFYNGAMSTRLCQRLEEGVKHALSRPTRVLVLWGGEDFWSNGIDLNRIERDPKPAEESWRNIQAMDDLVERILRADSHLTVAAVGSNAGAGGVFLALALDQVWIREGVVLNPHYKNMGNLYGSEYWTYSLPRRVPDPARRKEIQALRLPIGAADARRLGLVDRVLSGDREEFRRSVLTGALELGEDSRFHERIRMKRACREEDEKKKPLSAYREEELRKMRLNFFGFDPSYHVARYNFVHRVPLSKTPLHLAVHRARA